MHIFVMYNKQVWCILLYLFVTYHVSKFIQISVKPFNKVYM